MKRVALIGVRLAWLAICLTALIASHRAYHANSDWKTEEYLALEMMVLSFPASFLVVAGLILAGATLGLFGLALPPSSKIELTVTWLLFVFSGYIQWFAVIPRLWRKTRSRRS